MRKLPYIVHSQKYYRVGKELVKNLKELDREANVLSDDTSCYWLEDHCKEHNLCDEEECSCQMLWRRHSSEANFKVFFFWVSVLDPHQN